MRVKTIAHTQLPTLSLPEAAAQELVTRRTVRRSLLEYCLFTFARFQPAWHLKKLIGLLEAVAWGKVRRLMVFMPPRHGKSEVCSVRFPTWYLGHKPQEAIIAASHTEGLAHKFSKAARDVTQAPQYQRLFPYPLDTDAVHAWQFKGKEDLRPNFIAVGAGGALTGYGGNGLIVDDPIKNWQQAYSKVYRDLIFDWYRSTARTRLQPNGWVVLVMQRWHHDDLAGRLLEQAAKDPKVERWTVLHLPAVNPEGRWKLPQYDALWPEQFGVGELEKLRAEVGPVVWDSLYQQDPKRHEGTIFKRSWFKMYGPAELARPFDEIIQAWDTAFEENKESDFSTCLTLGRRGKLVFILDLYREQVTWPDLERAAHVLAARWNPSRVLVENRGSGISLRQALVAANSFRWPVFPMPATLNKVVRAHQVSGQVEAGQVLLPEGAPGEGAPPWVEDLLDEVSEFDKGPHDDIVDALVHGLSYFAGFLGREPLEVQDSLVHDELESFVPELDEVESSFGGSEVFL